jgi:hypothetical protein
LKAETILPFPIFIKNDCCNMKTFISFLKVMSLIYPGHDVPLVKQGTEWLPVSEAQETIYLAEGLVEKKGQNNISISI